VKKICFLLFAITMFFIVSQVQGAEWLSIGKDRVGNELFYDPDTLTKLSTGITKVWMKGIYSVEGRKERIQERTKGKLTVENYEKLSYVMELQEINCAKREYRVMTYTDYSSDGGILHKFTVEQQSSGGWEPITPDSMGEIVDKIICPPPTSQKKK
jgi:hypothetical protein